MQKLKGILSKEEMTQRELAKKTGLTSRQINKIVQGYADPRLSSVKKIADALEIKIDDLIEKA